MFKYLWIVVIVALYLWWTFEAIKGFIKEIRCHKRFKFYYLPDVTFWYILVHAMTILMWSIVEFDVYYSK